MNKKILAIGSIIGCSIILLASLSSVVGFHTVKSSSAVSSPLFSVRSKRAIDEESKDIACDYVGKREESDLSIPKRDGRISSFQKALEIFSNLDEERFSKLVDLIKSKEYLFTDELRDDTNPNPFTIDGSGFQECLMLFIIELVISILVFIPNLIFSILLKLYPTIYQCPTCMWDCPTLQI